MDLEENGLRNPEIHRNIRRRQEMPQKASRTLRSKDLSYIDLSYMSRHGQSHLAVADFPSPSVSPGFIT